MFSKKSIKKLTIILGIIFIVLWFGGNLGLYLYMKHIFNPEIEEAIDYTPEMLKLKEAEINVEESFYLMGLKLKYPFYKENIKHIFPLFYEHQLISILISFEEQDKTSGVIDILRHSNNLYDAKEPLSSRILSHILYKKSSFLGFQRQIHYSTLKDFSWWNLLHNIRLSELLTLKAILLTTSENFKVYDVETSYLKGFLSETNYENGKGSAIFSFEWGDKYYNVSFLGIDNMSSNKVRDIISTVRGIDDIESSYEETKTLYKNKEKTNYPEELLLLSMISLKGATIDNLKELIKVMEDKNYKPYIIEEIKKEVEYLKR